LWTKVYLNKKIIEEKRFPKTDNEFHEMTLLTNKLIKFNSEIWNKKKETISATTKKPLSLKDPIKIIIPNELELFSNDLIAMHNIIQDFGDYNTQI
jgi:valyl-tRNA synthetase